MMPDANTPVRYLKGVGEARAKAMAKLGIETLRDLVLFFPRAYEDRTVFRAIPELQLGESACVRGIVASQPTLSYVRKGLTLVRIKVSDGLGTMAVTFFNMPYIKNALIPGETYVFFGKNTGNLIAPAMTNPVFERDGAGNVTGKLVPIYPMTSGLTQKAVSSAVRTALDACLGELPDPLPEEVRRTHHLAQSRYAYETIHFPKDAEELELARHRMIFEELFLFSCALTRLRGQKEKSVSVPLEPGELQPFYDALPFSLTGAQKRAIREAAGDLASAIPMARLVQGDVGSGKTAVAAALCYLVWRSGKQSAFMAPTEILAGQHARTLTGLLEPMGLRVGLFTGSMTAKQKREAAARLASGEIDLAVALHRVLLYIH